MSTACVMNISKLGKPDKNMPKSTEMSLHCSQISNVHIKQRFVDPSKIYKSKRQGGEIFRQSSMPAHQTKAVHQA